MPEEVFQLEIWVESARRRLESLPNEIRMSQACREYKAADELIGEAKLLQRLVDTFECATLWGTEGVPKLHVLLTEMHQDLQRCAQIASDKGDEKQAALCRAALEEIETELREPEEP